MKLKVMDFMSNPFFDRPMALGLTVPLIMQMTADEVIE